MCKKCGIYSITNKKTGQKYIGQSIHIEQRFEQHKHNKKPVTYIDRAINKYGADNFEFKILEKCKPTELGIHFGHQRVWEDDNDVWDY